jgi:hypothetical protein
MMTFFKFEEDFVDSLRCIPMQVRYKLDTCGVKLKLSDWSHMTQDEREKLVELPCKTTDEAQSYADYLQGLILQHTGAKASEIPIDSHPSWLDTNIPETVQEKAQETGITLTPEQWIALTPLQRFALIKLSRSEHENKNFPHAMEEFGLV